MAPASLPIQDLPGLSPAHAEALSALGLTTVSQLYRYGQSPAQRQQLAQTLAVPQRYVAKWMVLADLARIPSVGCNFSGLLLHAGVLSMGQLAESSPQILHKRVRQLHVKTMQRSDLCPSPDQVNGWIHQAKQLARSTP